MTEIQIISGRRHLGPEVVAMLFFLLSHATVNCIKASSRSFSHESDLRNSGDTINSQVKMSYVNQRHLVRRDANASVHHHQQQQNSSSSSSSSSSVCQVACQGIKQRPICASDGATYSSKCELRRLRDCFRKDLKVIHKGRCPGETKCQEERRTAKFELLQRPGQDIYIPECKTDGNFMETQCHNGTGYCWCVSSDGKPIPGSSVEGHNTDCLKSGREKSRINDGSNKHRRGVGGKDCSPFGRSIFNMNLIKRFKEEYARAPRQPQQQSTDAGTRSTAVGGGSGQCQGDIDSCTNRRVVEWKFSELDKDKDMELKRRELKTLRYLVNKLVEPYACALSFLDYCDWDSNKKIALPEWSKCLRVVHITANGNNSAQTSNPKSRETVKKYPLGPRRPPRIKPGPSQSPKTNTNSKGIDLSQKRVHARMPLKSSFYDLKSRTKHTLTPLPASRNRPQESEDKVSSQQTQQPGSSEAPSSRLRPCEEERQKAKEMDRADPDGHIFIPECDQNGVFKKAQCHNSTGYCWCVDDKTGIPIPGISTHNVTPDCSDVKTNRLKGCPFPTKKRFLTELLDHITQEMVERANNDTSTSQLDEPDPEQSIEERAVRWKLATMDTNHNGILEKGESKDFREEIKGLKGDEKYMRKCRRNFLHYCDEDNDSKITMDEWVNCMGLNEQPKNLPENPKRRGKNPFSTILQS